MNYNTYARYEILQKFRHIDERGSLQNEAHDTQLY